MKASVSKVGRREVEMEERTWIRLGPYRAGSAESEAREL
jgi:hypothetical protein